MVSLVVPVGGCEFESHLQCWSYYKVILLDYAITSTMFDCGVMYKSKVVDLCVGYPFQDIACKSQHQHHSVSIAHISVHITRF